MENKKNWKRGLVVALAYASLGALVAAGGTFAYFTSTKNSDKATITVAHWEFKVNDVSTTVADNFKFNLVRDAGTTEEEVVAGHIAPGVGGSFTIKVDNIGDTLATYDLTFVAENVPQNVKFYKDKVEDANLLTASSGTYTVRDDKEIAHTSGTETVTVYWTWDYGTTVEADQEKIAEGSDFVMGVTATVSATQVDPNAA